MVATFSPHRDGGTLHLPSPTGIHHVDASSAIRQLRRSLSRSPSKSSDFRFLSRPHSQANSNTPFISSPLSPSRRGNLFFVPATTSNISAANLSTPAPSKSTFAASTTPAAAPPATPVAVPFPPSAKITRPLMRRTGSLPNTRPRTSPKSPSKRVLNISSDQGNATVTPPVSLNENEGFLQEPSITSSENFALFSTDISTDNNNNSNNIAFKPNPHRIEKRRSGNFGSLTTTVSPLKRSDGAMNLDRAEFASPSAKRRSLHSVGGTPDFSIFDATDNFPSSNETSDNMSRETEVQLFTFSSLPGGNFATIPKRSSSLRRSTLQQRQGERSLFNRSRLANVDFPDSPPKSPIAAMQQRYPLGSSLSTTPSHDSVFTPQQRPASSNPLFANVQRDIPSTTPHAAHPLSRTITQSSSSSSLADDSPTHEPIHKTDRPRPIFNFSKSLPVGATRPEAPRQFTREDSNTSTDSFATPENYRQAKPYAAAFMSTGLISKKNRNADDLQSSFGSSKNMPDTPCKRSSTFLPSAQKALPVRPISRPKLARQTFVAPSTPSHHAVPASGPFSRGNGVLGNVFSRPYSSRRDSFASVDGDDRSISNSPSARRDNQRSTDFDLPPTPTKQTFPSSQLQGTPHGDPSVQLQIDSLESTTPCTPKDNNILPDPSGLSISAPNEPALSLDDLNASTITFPATPTAPRDYFAPTGQRKSMSLGGFTAMDVDTSLTTRFDKVELIGTGEFSQVYRVSNSPENTQYKSIFSLPSAGSNSPSTLPERVWAVKKSKQAFGGPKDRSRRMREVEILRALANSDHVISFVDHWEDRGHLYIQTEYCEEGSLDVFLAQVGLKARLDDFRIWKILLELSQGLKHIHDSGFIHLDIKPANVLITFEGVLKIGDFGMATTWPAEKHIEGEGDREYMGPEVLLGMYDKPADIFALGLIMFEIAGNVELPDNGLSWQKLRNGDISDVPSLTWSSETSILRDSSGNPLSESSSFDELCRSDPAFEDSGVDFSRSRVPKLQQLSRSGELVEPPAFMVDANHEDSLDKLVRWMITPDPASRPTADQLLQAYGTQWAMSRRRAGATVFEGNWGPADDILQEDAEMIDV
ncbi:protein kinase, putative [Talaromyces stipitatus ATCC 10500]|uniref:Protein kinase, putative n=1 Tax=Talaromyces stipitatus (strain ATCC 10500 / CBS 375.48 / QM 6759 / NRRL 1006) TaxID=441959 RepID=B8M110_TALSN|nr:protein kinase, putative [Talaromyces stipitatus ATCC 10500]EED21790.1 protein kinase, putative [Talaromyces stipitatus ATCC 10500]